MQVIIRIYFELILSDLFRFRKLYFLYIYMLNLLHINILLVLLPIDIILHRHILSITGICRNCAGRNYFTSAFFRFIRHLLGPIMLNEKFISNSKIDLFYMMPVHFIALYSFALALNYFDSHHYCRL